MSSSTSRSDRRRRLSWVAWAALGFVVLECGFALFAPPAARRDNFMEFSFDHEEDPARLIVADKLRLLGASDPVILQVGDSSGFHGVQPPVVESVLPGARFINMNVFASLGYDGYYAMAKHMFRNNANIKVLVLYVSPGFQPNDNYVNGSNLLGPDIEREYNSGFHALFHVPSLAWRGRVTSALYGAIGGRPDTVTNTRYPDARLSIAQSGGWTREHDTKDDTVDLLGQIRTTLPGAAGLTADELFQRAGEGFGVVPDAFDWRHLRRSPLADQVFDRFQALADAHGARFVLAVAPLAEGFHRGEVGRNLDHFASLVERYARSRPQMGFIPGVYWPNERFSSPPHIATPFTMDNSLRFASALKAALGPEWGALARRDAQNPAATAALRVDEEAPTYGFAPAQRDDAGPSRQLLPGRREGLVYVRAPAGSREVELVFAAPEPAAVAGVQVAAAASRDPLARVDGPPAASGPGRIAMRWLLSPAASAYGGWMELRLSDQAAASQPPWALAEIRFH